jgi:ParB-like chromosome segregation protein Spo0J
MPKKPRPPKAKSAMTTIAMWPLERIKPYPQNPRSHPDSQIDLLARLLKKWDADQPIVVDEKGIIIKGHGRRLAAIKAGMKEFPVLVRAGLSAAAKRAMRIADNQVSLLAAWDKDMLRFEIDELQGGGDFEVGELGFDEDWLEKILKGPESPSEFQSVGENIPVEHECPKCHYRWSGFSGLVQARKVEDAEKQD